MLLSQLLQRVPNTVQRQVETTRQRLNTPLREYLRKETGLLLNRGDHEPDARSSDLKAIPITLVAGMPEAWEQSTALRNLNARQVVLARYLGHLRSLIQSGQTVVPMFDELAALAVDPEDRVDVAVDRAQLGGVLGVMGALLAEAEQADPVKAMLNVNADVLGMYRYRVVKPGPLGEMAGDPLSGNIELYWAVIGLIAELLGVTVEALGAVVLAHELAHAYTHLGVDIDGERWPSRGFAKTETAVVEGLAQYYTARVCDRAERLQPGVKRAYAALLAKQPSAYHTHEPWLTDHTPEQVRLALLDLRHAGAGSLDEFKGMLLVAKTHLSRNPN